jgi:hypothetical protein
MKTLRTAQLAVSVLALVALAAQPALSETRDACARFEIPWAMTLPDGTTHESGDMTLCLQQMWTPASGLHEIRIDGASSGLFMSRAGESEGLYSRSPLAVFERNGSADYRLVGYAWPDGDVMRTYMLHEFGKKPSVIDRNTRLPLAESEKTAVLVAVRTR